MKRFIFTAVLLSIVCTLLSNEAIGSALKNKREEPQCPDPITTGTGICISECGTSAPCPKYKICCFNGCGYSCVWPVGE